MTVSDWIFRDGEMPVPLLPKAFLCLLLLVASSYGDDTVERVGDDAAPDTETQQADAPTKADEPAATKQATKYNCRLFDLVSGAPVAGATVTIQRRLSGGGKPFEQWPTKRESDCTTDAEGRYTVDIRPDEAAERKLYVEIRTKHPDYVDYYGGYSYTMITKNLTMRSKPFFTSIGVWPAVKIMGTVVTPDGKPAAGIKVTGFSKFELNEMRTRGFSTEGRTDEKGTFELNGIRGGKSTVTLWADDYSLSTHVVEPRLSELGKIALDYLKLDALASNELAQTAKTHDLGRLMLEEGIEIAGRVVDADGAPLTGVWVNADREVHDGLFDGYYLSIDRSALTDAQGRYRMRPLSPGTYRVTPQEKPSERSLEDRTPRPVPAEFFRQEAKLKEGEKTATVDFRAVPHVNIVAQYYRSSGEPCGGHEIFLSGRRDAGSYSKRCRPDANGRIECTAPLGLEKAGFNLITNEHSALRHRVSKEAPLKNDRNLQLGTLTGDMKEIAIIRYVAPILLIKVVDENDRPIEKSFVRLEYAPGQSPLGDSHFIRNDRPAGQVSLDRQGDGRWRTSQLLPDEEVELIVSAEGYETEFQKLSLPEGETREIQVVLKRNSQQE